MRHVDHEHGADLVCDLAHMGEVDLAGIGAVPAEQDVRFDFLRLAAERVMSRSFVVRSTV